MPSIKESRRGCSLFLTVNYDFIAESASVIVILGNNIWSTAAINTNISAHMGLGPNGTIKLVKKEPAKKEKKDEKKDKPKKEKKESKSKVEKKPKKAVVKKAPAKKATTKSPKKTIAKGASKTAVKKTAKKPTKRTAKTTSADATS